MIAEDGGALPAFGSRTRETTTNNVGSDPSGAHNLVGIDETSPEC